MKKGKITLLVLAVLLFLAGDIFVRSVTIWEGEGIYYAHFDNVDNAEWIDSFLKFWKTDDGNSRFTIYSIVQTVPDESVAPGAIIKTTAAYSGYLYKHVIGDLYISPDKTHSVVRLSGDGEKARVGWVIIEQVGYDWWYNELEFDDPDDEAAVSLFDGDGRSIAFDGIEFKRINRIPENFEAYIYSLDNYGS